MSEPRDRPGAGSGPYAFGVLGLGVMGANLARNIERNGFSVALHNRTWATTERLLADVGGGAFEGFPTLEAFVAALARPRRILLMVKAGRPVDLVIDALRPLLDEGDVVIDGGNSHYPDTDRRVEELLPSGIRFFGMGVSGGEEGALRGPSLMPGGDEETYRHLEPVLTKIAAVSDSGPCVTYVGRGSAGHFVKMVHNGIEYGDMQLIAEAYDLMRNALGMAPEEIAATFSAWNEGPLRSFLIEITAQIVDFPDDRGDGTWLLDRILDAAGQKGTGKWTTIAALDVGVAIPTITAAVDARIVSGAKPLRTKMAGAPGPAAPPAPGAEACRCTVDEIRDALYAAKICTYAQGFDLLRAADTEHEYGLRLAEIARIWKAGCIIRAALLDHIRAAYDGAASPEHLLLDDALRREVIGRRDAWQRVVAFATARGIPVPAIATSLAYFDALRRECGPANLIQAQRDFFGAHTYRRIDLDGDFHTDWSAREPN